MRVLVVGGTGLAMQVGLGLRQRGDDVTMVCAGEKQRTVLSAAGLRVVPGDPLVPGTLERAGALRADVVACCLPADEENLVASLLAKRRYNVPRVIASVNDPANQALFDQRWGVDELVSPSRALVALIQREPTAD